LPGKLKWTRLFATGASRTSFEPILPEIRLGRNLTTGRFDRTFSHPAAPIRLA